MKIIIMRHGEAEPWQGSDAERTLTSNGEAQAQWMGARLPEWIGETPEWAWISPYRRAQQTWQHVSDAWASLPNVMTVEEIIPEGDPQSVLDYLMAFIEVKDAKSVILVSHLPLVADLVFGLVPDAPLRSFSTASAVAIEWDISSQKGQFLWQHSANLG